MRYIVRTGSVLLMIAIAASMIAGCGSSGKHNSDSSALIVPKDPESVVVVVGKATTLDLGGGADLIIPPGAMTPGATVRATYQGKPAGNWSNIAPTFAPVELISNPPNAIHGLLTLEFPVPVDKIIPGVDPTVQFGISTYDSTTNTWTPFNSTYDAARHMVVAQIPHFSWWNPFTWDFDALFARVAQDFGQLVGARKGQATCSSVPPAWVGSLAGVVNDADVAIRSCAQAQQNILDVEIVNNRPYGQVLTYGSSVKWGWHEGGNSFSDTARNKFMDVFMTPNELYLPPLAQASVGIFEPKAGTNSIFHIGPTKLSIGTDFVFYLLGQGIDNLPQFSKSVPKFGQCVSLVTQAPLTDMSVSGLRDDLVAVAGCVEQAFTVLVATGVLDKVSISKLATLFGRIKEASLLAAGIALAGGLTWKIGDLVADWIVNQGSMLGNGFSVYAKNVSNPTNSNGSGSGKQPGPVVPPGGSPVLNPKVTLAQGPVTSGAAYRYAVTLSGFQANVNVSVECYDSVSSSGFYNFGLSTDASGNAFTQSQCYSGDGPDHWVVANGVTSNHVQWGGTTSPPPPPPPPPPITYSETVGGDAHTWTNYSNAGGVQGPTIPAYQTVQIACKVTGFRVADGNTWWYRIASAPWSNAYYVSADAFYNNGATSGSLHGTPFVDPAVPDC